jgi:hypothetical protein
MYLSLLLLLFIFIASLLGLQASTLGAVPSMLTGALLVWCMRARMTWHTAASHACASVPWPTANWCARTASRLVVRVVHSISRA